MPQQGLMFRILIASPSDCIHERRIIPQVIHIWNAVNSRRAGAIIEPVMWETHTRPELGDRPQGVVNRQIVEDCDILVGTFWTRLGTPTGEAESGTAEEIERFLEAGKPVMLYFSSAPVVPDSIDPEQYQALTEYRRRLEKDGLISTYDSEANLREQFQRHLASQMAEILQAHGRLADRGVADESPSSNEVLRNFRSQLDNFIRRFSIEWASERDSEPMEIDEGKYVLSRAFDDVVSLRSMIIKDPSGQLSNPLDETSRELRSLSRHQLYIDGGVSFREFWDRGDRIIQSLNDLLTSVDEILSENGDA